jgi:hypothetical protein
MGKGYSKRINGECITQHLDNKLEFFKTINAHVVMYSPPYSTTPRDGGTYGCKSNQFYPTQPYIQQIPASYKYTATSLVRAGGYGKSSDYDVVDLRVRETGEPIYFNSSNFAKIAKRPYVPYQNPADIKYAQGPAFSCAHCFVAMSRKMADENVYTGRLEHEFVDSIYYPRNEEDLNKPNPPFCDGNEGGITKNWLSFAHPANFLFTSVPEPFKIKKYYEECGLSASTNANYGGFNFMPFCSPLNTTNYDGSKYYGQYKGFTFILIFGQNAINFPIKKYMPENPISTNPKPPKIDPTRAMYSLEIWTFMATDNANLGSPLIGKVRYWLYSMAPQKFEEQFTNWRDPFRILFAGPSYNAPSYSYRMNARVVGTPSVQALTLNLSGLQVLVTY